MKRHSILGSLRRQFTTGLVVIVPLLITVLLIGWLFLKLDYLLGRYFAHLIGWYIHGLGFISLILLIWLTGLAANTYVGMRVNRLKDFLLGRIPLVGSLFNSIKQVSDGVLDLDAGSFEQVVLFEYPRHGLYALGFITSRLPSSLVEAGGNIREEALIHVFAPTVPNPTSGYVLLIPQRDILPLGLSVEEGMKLVLSLGLIHPRQYRLRPALYSPADRPPDSGPQAEPGNSGV